MSVQTASVAANLERVRERICRAVQRAGRKPEEVTLVGVSKTFSAEAVRAAYRAGVRHFGENRVQEWEAKQPLLADLDATWHLVGHLQSNKAARAARLFHSVDSLDSMALAQKLDRAVAEGIPRAAVRAEHPSATLGTSVLPLPRVRLPVLMEVRLAPEETKAGVSEADLPGVAEAVLALPHLELRGLMCIPPYFDDPERARSYFRKLRELRDALCRRLAGRGAEAFLPELSMGMSHDFEVAIEEGATQIRLGTALFGPRVHE